jgi:hypothetical protein
MTLPYVVIIHFILFRHVQKIAIATVSFVMSVHVSIDMEQLGFHCSIFMKFDI